MTHIKSASALAMRSRRCLDPSQARRTDSTDDRSMDNTSAFDQLLQGAAAQPEPQRLLFVFAAAELPEDATPAQRERFAASAGGTLEPVICVGKGLDELISFDALVTESESREVDACWHVVFAAGLSGSNGQPPSAEQVNRALQTMIERVRSGKLGSFLALDKSGGALQFV